MRDGVDVVTEREAIDLLNVEFSTRGSLQQRNGFAKFTSTEGTNRYDSLTSFYTSGGTKRIIAGAGNRLEAIETTGALVGGSSTSTSPTASPHYFARWGGYTSASVRVEAVYASNGTDELRRYDTTNGWTTPDYEDENNNDIQPKGKYVAGWGNTNRLVTGNTTSSINGSLSRPSRVEFSDVGDPETWPLNNFVEITPGDGEAITGMATFREFLIVFKETKFAVFYGESVDASGNAIFNYRMVDAGVGLAAPRGYAVAPEGIYFLDRTGVYLTTGTEPKLVSSVIDPMFVGGASAFFASATLNAGQITKCAMEWHNDRVYLSLPTSGTVCDRMLVFDARFGWWTLYDIPAADMVRFRIASNEELVFAYSGTTAVSTKHLGRFGPTAYTADDMSTTGTGGNAIIARWRSGWFNYGQDSVKRIRELKVWGGGAFEIAVSEDYQQPSTFQTVTFDAATDLWGDGTDVTDVWEDGTDSEDVWSAGAGFVEPRTLRGVGIEKRGTVFSSVIRNNLLNARFNVNRLSHHVADMKRPSTQQTEVPA